MNKTDEGMGATNDEPLDTGHLHVNFKKNKDLPTAMTTENSGLKWIDLFHKREKLEGTRIVLMIKHLASSQYALNRNYQEAFNAINAYEQDLSIWAVVNRPKLEAFQREFLRLLHNYLASIFSLIQHTIVFCKDLDNKDFNKYYNEELEKLKVNQCIKFFKDLRNYTQHRQLPFISATLSFTATNPEKGEGISVQKLVLHKKDLLTWENWSSDSKEYINKFEKEIDLKNVIEEYQKPISQFYSDLYKKVAALYSKQIEELFRLESEMLKIQGNTEKH